MDLLDIKHKLEELREVLVKEEGDQKKRFVAGQGGQREQVVAPSVPAEVKGKAEPGAAGIQANPNQLSEVDPAKIKQVPAQQSPDHDRTLTSRSSIPVSSKPEAAPEKPKSILDTRPTGHIHKSGVWDSLDDLHRHHLMNTMKQSDRDIVNSMLEHQSRQGQSKEQLVEMAKGLIAGKVKKLDQAKEGKATKTAATKGTSKPKVTQEDLEISQSRAKEALAGFNNLSKIPLGNLKASREFIKEREAKGSKFYHSGFSADGQYTSEQTHKALHDWAHGRPLPKEVTDSVAFKTHLSNYKPTAPARDAKADTKTDTKYVAGKDGLERTQGTPTEEPKQDFKPKTISLDD